jgi:amino acid adenylation domain-containing protein
MAGESQIKSDPLQKRLSELSPRKRALVEQLLHAGREAEARPMDIPRRTPSDIAPLSYAQQRMWFLNRLYPGTAALNCDFAIRLRLQYNVPVLERTLAEVVRRHETLRTTFREVNGETVQVIAPFLHTPLNVVDLSALPEAEREVEALRISTEEAQAPFDLTRGPLLRTKLLKLADEEFILLVTVHHIIADYSSMLVFFNEVKTLYMAYSLGWPSMLEEPPIQYADFAIWQRSQFQGGALRDQLEYWKRQLDGLPRLRLPTDRPYAATATWEGDRLLVELPADLMSAVRELGQRNDCTLFMTTLAAFQVLLHRYSGQEDIGVGVPIANRMRPGTQNLIGFFVNSLVMRTRLSGEMTFRELLQRVRHTAQEAFANQDLPFERLVEEMHPDRDATQHPLFQVAFQTLPVPAAAPEASRMGIERQTATIDLAFEIEERPEAPVLRIEYSTNLFNEPTMVRWAGHYRRLLEAIVANPDQPIAALPLLSDSERKLLLADWNRTTAEYPRHSCLHTLIEEQTARNPDAIALTFSGSTLTYAELNGRADSLAIHLQSLGVGPETLVGVCLERSFEMVVALLGVLKAGGAYVPLDPTYPKDRLRSMIEDAGIEVLLTKRMLAQVLPPSRSRLVFLDEEWLRQPPAAGQRPQKTVQPGNMAYMMYTSGSTGRPKGVMVEHRAIVNQLCWMQRTFPLNAEDCIVQKYAFTFDVSAVEIYSPLIAGARLVLAEPGKEADCGYLLELLAGEKVTVFDSVPSLVEIIVEEGLQQKCPSLRMLTCGGEAMPLKLLDSLRESPNLQINNMYGPTETTVTATSWTDSRNSVLGSVPIGRPVANTRLYILDALDNPTPIGVPGELHIGGDGLARGYFNNPELNAERFIDDPFSDSANARLFRTGDLARYLPDGNVEFLGRIDRQVKVRGFRIELGEIETALSKHPLVEDCAVTVQPDAQGGARIATFVVPREQDVEFWPSVGEYFIYDELLYFAMTTDERRNNAYRQAIAQAVRNKTVVDIGTGGDAIQARFCIEAGARRVYAIEMLDTAFDQAKALIKRLGLEDKIILIHGDSTQVTLPEKVDVCVSELIGTIGSSEGAIALLNDARRFLNGSGVTIPYRSITKIAAVSLPDETAVRPRFSPLSAHYTQEVFKKSGYSFDVRLCVKNLPKSSVVSDSGIFEDLEFQSAVPLEERNEIRLAIGRDCRLDGFLLWLNLYPGEQVSIDVWSDQYSWLPVFFPVFSPGIEVQQGDVIEAVCERVAKPARWMPDYRINGVVRRQSGGAIAFSYESSYDKPAFKQNAFYRALFSEPSNERSQSAGDPKSSLQIESWRQEYEDLYGNTQPLPDPQFNSAGWDSTYTGDPLSEQDMREQVESTVERILSVKPKRVLEIGCGTGLLLFKLVPHVDGYVGTDFSRAALDYVKGHLSTSDAERVTLLERSADNVSGLEPASFDIVVLNSVVQYFPNAEYLIRVLTSAMRMAAPGGYIFVGDVRSLPLLEAFHTSVELYRAEKVVSLTEIRDRVRQRISHERELVIDPAFFAAMGHRFLPFARAQVMLKRGSRHNELTCFRYDVLMQTGIGETTDTVRTVLPWDRTSDLSSLARRLSNEMPEAILISSVPSRRLQRDVRAVEVLENANGSPSIEGLQAALDGLIPGVEPEDFWTLERELPYRVHITWPANGALDAFDVHLVRSDRVHNGFWASVPVSGADDRPMRSFTNSPVEQQSAEELGSTLRSFLRGLLPEYMVPAAFIRLNRLPRTANGKLDRKALAEVARPRTDSRHVFVNPRTELEQSIAAAWKEVLKVDQVGVHDNFFDLGGHSLLLVRLHMKLREFFGSSLTITDLFRFPTVGALAAHLSANSITNKSHQSVKGA